MATFLFSETDGTDLETIDSKWSGDSTTLVTSSGGIQPSTNFGDRYAYYSNGHGDDQTAEAVIAAGSFAGGEIKGVLLNWDGTNGYEARLTATTVTIRRNGAFFSSGTHGLDPSTNDVTLKATKVGAVVKGYANGVEITSGTDGTPVNGGSPGLHLGAAGSAAATRMLSWTDGVAAATLDQTHYRFRNDDGSETGATWAASEDTPITLAKNTPKRLRVQIQSTGDKASASYKLQYRKVGDTTWKDVLS